MIMRFMNDDKIGEHIWNLLRDLRVFRVGPTPVHSREALASLEVIIENFTHDEFQEGKCEELTVRSSSVDGRWYDIIFYLRSSSGPET